MIITADESVIEQIQNNTNASLFKSIILDSNGDNVEFPHVKTIQPEIQPPAPKKSKTGSLTCVVCGSPANGYNFDAITCESCKAFFRRNAFKDPVRLPIIKYIFITFISQTTLECRRNSNCDITSESRRRCAACRLTKCLNSGMKRDRLSTVLIETK